MSVPASSCAWQIGCTRYVIRTVGLYVVRYVLSAYILYGTLHVFFLKTMLRFVKHFFIDGMFAIIQTYTSVAKSAAKCMFDSNFTLRKAEETYEPYIKMAP